ncbi:MAG: hypothetical protein K0Q59_4278 [Paenibacillus sp.]|jgi:uncharacterized membrane protein|nr:hypothetical protein [Paenibacillus sp.]
MAKRKWSKEEIEQYRKVHGPTLYFNKEDSNLFVRKAFGYGFTVNWANPISWILIVIIVGVIGWRMLFK